MIIFDGEGGVGAAKFFFPFSSAMCKMVNYKNVKAMIKAHLGREAEADSGEGDGGGQKNSREGAAISKTANCVSSFNIHFITEEEGRGHFLSAKGIWMRIAALGSGSGGNHQREEYQEERNFPFKLSSFNNSKLIVSSIKVLILSNADCDRSWVEANVLIRATARFEFRR